MVALTTINCQNLFIFGGTQNKSRMVQGLVVVVALSSEKGERALDDQYTVSHIRRRGSD
jgi:hypothetical protein